ncbi:MAG: hypothetical protein WCW93_01005 [Candidatus Paceibacterota bacterium]
MVPNSSPENPKFSANINFWNRNLLSGSVSSSIHVLEVSRM